MRKLNQYMSFNFAEFQAGKEFAVQSARWNENKECVTLNVVITKDDSGENLFEKFYAHLVQDTNPDKVADYPAQAKIVFEQIGKCTPWGDYNSNLSVEAVVKVVKS